VAEHHHASHVANDERVPESAVVLQRGFLCHICV